MTTDQLNLIALPYDIRYLVYEHLFPPGKQIYIQALPNKLKSITPNHTIPTALLQTCKQLHAEASGYFYNRYLFNVVGRKTEVLALYETFNKTVEKYAREEVHVNPFSNGGHSATMCVSIHTGDGKMDVLTERGRGIAMKIQEVQAEVGYYGHKDFQPLSFIVSLKSVDGNWKVLAAVGFSVVIALLAWYISAQQTLAATRH